MSSADLLLTSSSTVGPIPCYYHRTNPLAKHIVKRDLWVCRALRSQNSAWAGAFYHFRIWREVIACTGTWYSTVRTESLGYYRSEISSGSAAGLGGGACQLPSLGISWRGFCCCRFPFRYRGFYGRDLVFDSIRYYVFPPRKIIKMTPAKRGEENEDSAMWLRAVYQCVFKMWGPGA